MLSRLEELDGVAIRIVGEHLPARRSDPRVERSRHAIQEAALCELADVGHGRFTIDSVATRCGVARSTIYRLWSDKAALIAAAFETLNHQPESADDAETPRERIQTLVHHLADVMSDSIFSACLPALIAGAEHENDLRNSIMRSMIAAEPFLLPP